jgi:site-specific DNA-methyltransferase (adenine-specific)
MSIAVTAEMVSDEQQITLLQTPEELAYVTEAATGLTFREDTPVEVWGPLVARLIRQKKRIHWAIADAINFGGRKYGEMYAQWVEETGLAEKTLANIAWVGRSIESSRRREDVDFNLQAEVAALPPDDQTAVLDEAIVRGWRQDDIREKVREVKQQRAREKALDAPAPEPASVPASVRCEVADARSLPLDAETVDLIVTSPPYGLEIGYEGGDVDPWEWQTFMAAWLEEAWRVTKWHGRLALNIPLDTSEPVPRPTYAQAIAAAMEAGWLYQATITWHEGNTTKGNRSLGSLNSSARPHPVDSSEMIALFSKGEWAPSSENPDDIEPLEWQAYGRGPWTFPGESSAWDKHPAPFPVELPSRLIRYLCRVGDTVLDPFCGSGTTLLAALVADRRGIGFDISASYVDSALRRVVRKGQVA